MKKALIVILIVILVLAVLTAALFLVCWYIDTYLVLDKNGMENPNYDPEEVYPLDGDFTYVNNDALLPVLVGTWESGDGRYGMTLSEDYRILLTLDGETVLEDTYNFIYLQPGDVYYTELTLNKTELTQPDGTVSQIHDLHHEVSDSDDNGIIILSLSGDSIGTEEIEFTKQ